MSLYVVTIPVTVETYATDPGQAVAQARRAVQLDWTIAAPAANPSGRIRVRMHEIGWRSHAAIREAASYVRGWSR